MFKKLHRLPGGVKVAGLSFNSQYYALRLGRNDLKVSRFGIIVSRKIDKRATARNRIKRRIRFCLDKNFKNIVPGFDLLFIAKKYALGKTTDEICKNIEGDLTKLKIL